MRPFLASTTLIRGTRHQRFTTTPSAAHFTRPVINSSFRKMSTGTGDLGIENTNIKTAPGVSLDESQKALVGIVLDLFAGRPSLKKLSKWADDGVFSDPITKAEGRSQYEAQWYGLQAAFTEIERLHHEVTDGGNPIGLDLKTRYVVKGVKKEQVVNSKVLVYYDKATEKITKVEDKWDGELPDSSFTSIFRKLNAVTVPKVVGVPKNDEEDAKKGNQ